MMRGMRNGLAKYQREEDLKHSSEQKYYPWYTDVEMLVDSHYSRDDLMLSKLLDKLSNYGRVIILFPLCFQNNYAHEWQIIIINRLKK